LKTYRIAVIGGDGIGPEVTREGLKVLRKVAEMEGFGVELTEYPFGAEHYLKTGEGLPAGFLTEVRQYDAVLLGAIGDPRIEVGMLERAIISGLRFGLDLFVNLRPVKLYAESLCPLKGKKVGDIDAIVVRENTEDVYAGIGGIFKKGTPDEVAVAEMIFTRRGTERVIRYAFELARARGRKRVTMVDKANAIRAMDLWTRTFEEVGREYPALAQDHWYVDAASMQMVKSPESFDVVVTSNMFGDIITDLGGMITGGLGIAASGNIHPGRTSMFEPVHGSAPKFAGKNIANPIGAISSAALMFETLGLKKEAAAIDAAVLKAVKDNQVTSDIGGKLGTREAGDYIAANIR